MMMMTEKPVSGPTMDRSMLLWSFCSDSNGGYAGVQSAGDRDVKSCWFPFELGFEDEI